MSTFKLPKLFAAAIATFVMTFAHYEASAETIRVAVASNFLLTLKEIAAEFEKGSEHKVQISSASTGKLYAQILNGAPFDLFLAADAHRPELIASQLENGYQAKTYAYGRLVFVAYGEKRDNCIEQIKDPSIKRIAIANPATAPYGLAAKETMQALKLWDKLKNKVVMGENIAQTLHFIDSRNAQAGFVAKSQLLKHDIESTCQWDVPEEYHGRIEQKMLRLQPTKKSAAVDAFVNYMAGAKAEAIIKSYGYDVPDALPSDG